MQGSTPTFRLVWPPPGLEACQGVLWRKAGELGLASIVLVGPLLLSSAVYHPFNSLGFFGSAWWVLGLTSLLGSLLVFRALSGILGFFWKARRAATYGIDLEAALQVGADRSGDMGALLQGTRAFVSVEEILRSKAVRARIWATVLFLSSAVWILLGWAASLLLATRGILNPAGVWILTLGPAIASLAAALIALGFEGSALNSARGPLLWKRWKNPGHVNAARVWGEGLKQLRRRQGYPPQSGRRLNTVASLFILALPVLAFVPTASFTVATSLGSIVATMAVPKFSAIQQRAASAAALARYRLPSSPEISALEAGEALHALALAGRPDPGHDWFKAPAREWETGFLPEGRELALEVPPAKWHLELFPLAAAGLSPEAEGYLRRVAQHPALTEFETLARAGGLDVLGARFVLPLPPEASSFDIPIPRLSSIREGAAAMVALAVVQFLDGNSEQAEITLRTTLSAGLLLGAESPTLIDALIGYVMALNAGDALAGFFEASGRNQEADALRWVRETAQAAGKRVARSSSGGGIEVALQRMPATVLDQGEIRGLRWEYLWTLAGLGPCINPHQVAFGPGFTHEEFIRSARDGLIRYPAEEAVLDVMERGFFNFPTSGGWDSKAARVMSAVLGPRAGRCAAMFASGVF